MPARRYTLCLLAFLLIAAGPALASTHPCDIRVLPTPDTLSVEAAARKATDGKLPDIHVQTSCIIGTTTSVHLIRPNPTGSTNRREQWAMTCIREQSKWYKRGGWDCDTPTLTRDMDAEAPFLGAKSKLLISFDSTLSFETAESLARRALVLFENEPTRCAPRGPRALDWKSIRERELQSVDRSMLSMLVDTRDGAPRVEPFGSSNLTFEFQLGAIADPAHAPACWEYPIIID
jgi:hypothetical protein